MYIKSDNINKDTVCHKTESNKSIVLVENVVTGFVWLFFHLFWSELTSENSDEKKKKS